jgi:hypothetical protein
MGQPENRPWRWFEENWLLILLFGGPALTGGAAALAHWTPEELIGLMAVLLAAVLVAVGLVFWRRVRLGQADAALKQALLQKELTVEEIERLVTCRQEQTQPQRTAEQAVEDMAACLRQSGASEKVIEQVFTAVRLADPALRLVLFHAIRGLAGENGCKAKEKQILATVRGLCGNGDPPTASKPPAPEDRIKPA